MDNSDDSLKYRDVPIPYYQAILNGQATEEMIRYDVLYLHQNNIIPEVIALALYTPLKDVLSILQEAEEEKENQI